MNKDDAWDTYLFKMTTPDIIVCQRTPEFSKLVCEPSEATSDDGTYF